MLSRLRRMTCRYVIPVLLALMLLTACEARLVRNQDGSFTLDTTISESDMQSAITASISDPLIQELNVDLKPGYALVSGTRKRLNSEATDTLTFRLDLSVSAGQLTATISNALLDGMPVEEERVTLWNERIANNLSRSARRNPNSKLGSVTITESDVALTWIIEPK